MSAPGTTPGTTPETPDSTPRTAAGTVGEPATTMVTTATTATTVPEPLTPPLPPLFGDRWPVPQGAPTATMVCAVVVVGVAAAGAIPVDRPGLGWPVVALVAIAAALAVEWRARRVPPAGVWWSAATVALTAVSAIRDAEWLVTLCLLAAFGTAALAVVGSSGGVVAALRTVGLAALRSVPWFGKAVTRRADVRRSGRVVLAVAVGLVLLLVFGSLLAGADPVFGSLVGGLRPAVDEYAARWVVLLVMGAAGMGGICFLAVSAPTPKVGAARVALRGLEWTIPVGMLVALFAAFLGVTLTTMFGSDTYVRATTGLTYAEYARGGFWQLLAGTALALLVIMAAVRFEPASTMVQRRSKRGLLAALAGLTLIVVASATYRMALDQEAYGFTVLRVLVLACELWLGVAFVLVTSSVLTLRDRVPTRAIYGAGVATLLMLAVLNPERWIVEENAARFAATGQLDVPYLLQLSADAVPATQALPEADRGCLLGSVQLRLDVRDDDWRSANLARSSAQAAIGTGVQPC